MRANILRQKRGSASVLIILLVVLLVLFGVLSLVAAASNQRLAQKRALWNQTYYRTDLVAERFLAQLNAFVSADQFHALAQAEKMELLRAELAGNPELSDVSLSIDKTEILLEATIQSQTDVPGGIVLLLGLENERSLRVLKWSWWSPSFEYAGLLDFWQEETGDE